MLNTNEKFYMNDTGVYFVSGYLSQWHIAPMVIDGITFNCCEKRMMYMKAIKFNDEVRANLILESDEPKEIKKLGREVINFNDEEWDAVADNVVFNANLAKFSQNEDLLKLLLDTGDRIIVECAPYDCRWGNGLNITDTLKTPPDEWKGSNRLGKVLMSVRDALKN